MTTCFELTNLKKTSAAKICYPFHKKTIKCLTVISLYTTDNLVSVQSVLQSYTSIEYFN